MTGVSATTLKSAAAAATTVMVLLMPLMLGVAESAAVIVCGPAVFNVALNVREPLFSVPLVIGVGACGSVLVKLTVPVYPVAVLLKASNAVTVTLNNAAGGDGGVGHDGEVCSGRG